MEQYIIVNEKTIKEQITKLNEIIKNNNLYKLSDELEKILYNELKSGNTIREISVGGFEDKEYLFIFLNKPFIEKVIKDTKNTKYIEINDPHYWKAEYTDIQNKQTIACPF
ncbi:hypothetical protein [Brachyspira pulli]|uniref:hypothetical protein n=1 Tax=Brachyspira pulli TaxID=310721 RepID=UPI003004FB69